LLASLQLAGPQTYVQEVEDDSEDSVATLAIAELEAESLGIAASAAARAAAGNAAVRRCAAAVSHGSLPSMTRAAAGSNGGGETAGDGVGAESGQQLSEGEDGSAGVADMEEDHNGPAPVTLQPLLDFRLPDGILAGLKVLQLTANRSRQALEKATAAGPLTQQGRKGRAYWAAAAGGCACEEAGGCGGGTG
jgi:hypothetical protein